MAATTSTLQSEGQPLPPVEPKMQSLTRFIHPGYPASNTLLQLPRVDCNPSGAFGVSHRIALLACQIIAGNAFDNSRFTLDKEGQKAVDVPLDSILLGEAYYFIVGDYPSQYPVVPSFAEWEFPHGRLPDWPHVPAAPLHISDRCGISNFSFATQKAHILPQEEALWFRRNDMVLYAWDPLAAIDDRANILPLKADLHICFDQRWFAIIPRVGETATPRYMTHILSRDAGELWPQYHNTPANYLHQQSAPFLFARFAWAVLPLAKPFIVAGLPRNVIQIHEGENHAIERKEEYLGGSQLKMRYGGGGSRRATPMKRKSLGGSAADDDGSEEFTDDDDDFHIPDNWKGSLDERNAKRRILQRSSETAVGEDDQAQSLAELKTHLEEVLPVDTDNVARGG